VHATRGRGGCQELKEAADLGVPLMGLHREDVLAAAVALGEIGAVAAERSALLPFYSVGFEAAGHGESAVRTRSDSKVSGSPKAVRIYGRGPLAADELRGGRFLLE